MKKLCPNHSEKTPSCEVYPDGSTYCFGCGAYTSASSLLTLDTVKPKKQPEDLIQANEYIDKLPVKEIRGLMLPYDTEFYYIQYPYSDYYLKRKWLKEGSKYIGPTGHQRPILTFSPYVREHEDSTAYVIEGELNAFSLYAAYRSWDILSPGGCGSFKQQPLLDACLPYNNIAVCVDDDAAGREAAKFLQKELVKLQKNVVVYLMEEDFNDILVKYGKEKIKEIAEELTKKLIRQGWR